jgi:plastocyanin
LRREGLHSTASSACALVAYACTTLFAPPLPANGQTVRVTAQIEIIGERPSRAAKKDRANVVVWLAPLEDHSLHPVSDATPAQVPRLVQKDKKFTPHVLVVEAGTAVEFPNRDPFFHNVFSLFEGKRFDLGLYEAGTTRTVHFDRVGVSYIFCNIHPEMNAVVIALKTPYYGVSDAAGKIVIPDVPVGRYTLQVWAEATGLERLKSLSRAVSISEADQSLGVIRVVQDRPPAPHKNKYGRDYDAPGTDYPSNQQK